MVLLALRPVFGISVDPLIALPLGGIVCALATKNIKNTISYAEFGLSKVIGVSILLIGTGTLAGIIKVSAAAMIHAGATVIDSLPHGSFFHSSLIVSVIAILRIRFAGAITATMQDARTNAVITAIVAKGIFQLPPKCVITILT